MKRLLGILTAAAAALSAPAGATDATGNFHVTLTVPAQCQLAGGAAGTTLGGALNDLAFGVYDPALGNGVTSGASSKLTLVGVACSLGTTYALKLDGGSTTGTVTGRKMLRTGGSTGTAGDEAAYKLYCGATDVVSSAAAGQAGTTCATNWGNTVATAVSGLGLGVTALGILVPTPHTVNGFVAAGQNLTPGSFDDLVTVTLTY